MESTLIYEIAALGAGGTLALIMFLVYRQEKKSSEIRLNQIIDRDQATREKHTEVLTELVTLLRRMNGK